MIRIIPYDQSHFEMMELNECHGSESFGAPTRPGVTFVQDNRPVAIVGAFEVVPGVAHLWANVSKHLNIRFAKTARSTLDRFLKQNNIRRAQMTVRRDYRAGMRFARFLGFMPEGLMQKYGTDGTDYWLYARVMK